MTSTARPAAPVQLLPSARLAGLTIAHADIELSAPTGTLRPESTVSDAGKVLALVRLVGPEQGPPAAVLKLARSALGAAELRTQQRVLTELAIHLELDEEWHELLPRILVLDERTDATVSVESYRPGIDLAEVLARRPTRVEELTAAALSAIAPLHRRTATFVVVDNVCLLRRWVNEPLAELTDMCRRLVPDLVSEVDRLGTMLRQALLGRRMPVSWTHGDYTPRNVRVAGIQGPVTGIVDWGGARPGQPALIDEYLMILTASCQVERADFGAVVTERLRTGGLSDRERNALRAARDRPDGDIGDRARFDERVDERVAILLTWLHHAADLRRKGATHPDHHFWWATNVAPVLQAVAAWPGFDVSSARAAAPQAVHR
jgi:Phosphotransferase enzyme family